MVLWQLNTLWLFLLHVLGTGFQGLLQERPSASVQDLGQMRHPRAQLWPCPCPRIPPSCPLNVPTIWNFPAAPWSESCWKKKKIHVWPGGLFPSREALVFSFPLWQSWMTSPGLAAVRDLAAAKPQQRLCGVSSPGESLRRHSKSHHF